MARDDDTRGNILRRCWKRPSRKTNTRGRHQERLSYQLEEGVKAWKSCPAASILLRDRMHLASVRRIDLHRMGGGPGGGPGGPRDTVETRGGTNDGWEQKSQRFDGE